MDIGVLGVKQKRSRSFDKLKIYTRKLKDIGCELPHSIRDLACDSTVGFSNGTMVQVLQSWRHSNKRTIQNALHQALQTSSRAVRITNPYFLPPPKIKKDILDAASRGVDVKILTCGTSDVPIMAWATRHLYQEFIGSGVRIFEYNKKVLHSKTMIVDDVFSTFGSFNLDDWSYRRNLEMNIVMMDPEKAKELTTHFEEDLMDSEEITLDHVAGRGNMSRIWYFTCYQAARFPQRIEGLNSTKLDPNLSLTSLSYPNLSYPKPTLQRPIVAS
jgi:phosphatidylserine/phosphatidylglycerophosphate/cardiolipin synthase-like enzyme